MATRKFLAAIDHNSAVHRPIQRDYNGQPKYRVSYSKVAGRFVVKFEKEPKTYAHPPHLLARCLHERCATEARFHTAGGTRISAKVCNDPKLLAPNISPIQEDRQA